MLQGSHTECYTGAFFSTSLQKSLVGLKIPTRGQMNTGSSGNGNVVKHGLLRKLLLSFRANGSALCTFKDLIKWMCCLGNGLTTVSESWYKYGTPSDVSYHQTPQCRSDTALPSGSPHGNSMPRRLTEAAWTLRVTSC